MTFPDLTCPHCGQLVQLVNLPAFADPPIEVLTAVDETQLAGPDGAAIADLLSVPKAFTMSAIVEASMAATERARVKRRVDQRFWSPAEMGSVSASLAGLMGYSELIGRARIRLYQIAARGDTRAFASAGLARVAADWSILNPLKNLGKEILEGLEALASFLQDLIPIDVIPSGWVDQYRNLGFQRAVDTEAIVREKIDRKIADVPPEEDLPSAEDMLNEVGVGPANPSYPDLVTFINSHERFNIGGQDEQAKPDVQDDLPAWVYVAQVRPTSRPHHAARDGNFYPASQRFEDVRGHGPEEEANCLCSWYPLARSEETPI